MPNQREDPHRPCEYFFVRSELFLLPAIFYFVEIRALSVDCVFVKLFEELFHASDPQLIIALESGGNLVSGYVVVENVVVAFAQAGR